MSAKGVGKILFALILGVVVVCGGVLLYALLGLFGLAGNQVEHGNVSIDVSPDGQRIVFSSAQGGLFTLDLQTKQVDPIAIGPATSAGSPKYSPDGKRIAFAGTEGREGGPSIYIVPVSGGTVTKLTNDKDSAVGSFAFSLDGLSLCFMRAYLHRPYSMGGMVWDHWDACLLDLKTHEDRRLTHENYYGGGPVGFVDGGFAIIFSAMSHGNLKSTSYKVRLTSEPKSEPLMPNTSDSKGGAWASQMSVSRDGRLLTVLSDRETPYAYDVFVADSSGENAKPLHITNLGKYNGSPVIAPGGKSVYFLAGTEQNAHARAIFSLYRVDLDGRTTKIASSGLFTDPGKWRPG